MMNLYLNLFYNNKKINKLIINDNNENALMNNLHR